MCISHYFAHPELCTFPEVASSSDWEEGQHLGIIVTTTNAMAQAMAAEWKHTIGLGWAVATNINNE